MQITSQVPYIQGVEVMLNTSNIDALQVGDVIGSWTIVDIWTREPNPDEYELAINGLIYLFKLRCECGTTANRWRSNPYESLRCVHCRTGEMQVKCWPCNRTLYVRDPDSFTICSGCKRWIENGKASPGLVSTAERLADFLWEFFDQLFYGEPRTIADSLACRERRDKARSHWKQSS